MHTASMSGVSSTSSGVRARSNPKRSAAPTADNPLALATAARRNPAALRAGIRTRWEKLPAPITPAAGSGAVARSAER